MTIVLDAMGSDDCPLPEIMGAIQAAKDFNEKIILVGNQEQLSKLLSEYNGQDLPIEIVHASQAITMDDKAVDGVKNKPDSSMAVGLELVKNQQANAFVTAGNTGAAMFTALRKLGRMQNVLRPGLTTVFPHISGKCIVLDIGANVECRPEFLLQFGLLGSEYAKTALNIDSPRVGILSNGEEDSKGTPLVKESFKLLQNSQLNFIGNVESKEIFEGKVDVVVTDGFTGNVLIKTSEAVAGMIIKVLKEEFMASMRTKIGALLAKPAFSALKAMMDPAEIGAAPLLGVDGLVFIGHGRSDAKAIYGALRNAHQLGKTNLLENLEHSIAAQIEVQKE
ncbi:MAG: phosphate acyltransferase PlsX [Anaerolineaceae bacterium]|nr:phosphate acyltransferase PlsX [Anaerolineaceae bacterium]